MKTVLKEAIIVLLMLLYMFLYVHIVTATTVSPDSSYRIDTTEYRYIEPEEKSDNATFNYYMAVKKPFSQRQINNIIKHKNLTDAERLELFRKDIKLKERLTQKE